MSIFPLESQDMQEKYRFFKEYKISERYFDIFNNLEHEIYIIDTDFKIVFANDKKFERYGKDIIGKQCHNTFPATRREYPCANCPCKEVFLYGKDTSHLEDLKVKDKHGNVYYVNETAVPLRNEKDKPVLAVNIGRDITKRFKLAEIKKNLQVRIKGSDKFSEHISYIIKEIHKLGYERIRFYDVIDDKVKSDRLFVMRDSIGMNNMHEIGYRFYLKDEEYYPILQHVTEPRIWDGREVFKKYPNNKCLKDFNLQNETWLHLPLIVNDNLVGLITIDNKGGKSKISNEDLTLLSNFSEYMAHATLTIRAQMNLHILEHINRIINERRAEGEILETIVKEVCEKLLAGMCSIFIYSSMDQQLTRYAHYIQNYRFMNGEALFQEEYKQGQNVTGMVFQNGKPLNLIDIPALKRVENYEQKIGEINWNYVREYEDLMVKRTGVRYEIKNAIFAPLKFERETIGVIRLVNNLGDGRYPFPNSDMELLTSIARQIAALTQYEQMKDQIDGAILKITDSLISTGYKIPDIANEIVNIIRRISKASAVSLYLKNEDKKLLESIAVEGYPKTAPEKLIYDLEIDRSKEDWYNKIGITTYVAITGDSFSGDTAKQIMAHKSWLGKYGPVLYPKGKLGQSALIEPLKLNSETIGVLKIEDPEPNKFTKSFKSMFKIMANFAALAISSAQEIKRRDEFLISLGHELGIPAAGLVSLSEVMWKRYSEELEEQGKDEDFIKIRKKRLLNYCESLKAESNYLRFLTVGRAALDTKAKYDFEKHNLKRTITEVTSILESAAKWKYIDINYKFEKTTNVIILMDKEKLKQAFHNVLDNAIKYSSNNNIIDIEMIRYGGKIKVQIRDNGIGIAKGDEEKIFEKDYRGKNAYEVSPTGVGRGLYYSRMIIEKHGGQIKLTNNSKPTEFTLTFEEI